MDQKQKIYEGKAKTLYSINDPSMLIQYFKDDATAFNAEKKAVIIGKGILNNLISEYLMKGLTEVKIPNHFVRRLNAREQLIKRCDIIPLEVVVRNIASGSILKRLGIIEGTEFTKPLVELYLKNDELGDPLVSEKHVVAFQWATQLELEKIFSIALEVNNFLLQTFFDVKIKLVDFKIEIGRIFNNDLSTLIVADEISPDSCRLWDIETGKKLDKDIFRQNLGSLKDGYNEIAKRFGLPDVSDEI